MVVQKKSKGKESLPAAKASAGGHYCRCPKCKYVWKARVRHPKSCPECKIRLGWYNRRKAVK